MQYSDMITILVNQRKKLKITQEELSDLIGCDRTLITKWERQQAIPNVMNFMSWSNALQKEIQIKEIRQTNTSREESRLYELQCE